MTSKICNEKADPFSKHYSLIAKYDNKPRECQDAFQCCPL